MKKLKSGQGRFLAFSVALLVVVAGLAFFSFYDFSPATGTTVGEIKEENKKEFNITAEQFSFTPSIIKSKKGELVILNIKSIDADYGIVIPEYGINKSISEGKERTISFMTDEKGTFKFKCSVYCGPGHSEMSGKLFVN